MLRCSKPLNLRDGRRYQVGDVVTDGSRVAARFPGYFEPLTARAALRDVWGELRRLLGRLRSVA